MSKDLNRVMLLGNLGRDPELRVTPTGKSVVNLSVATNRQFKQADGTSQEHTEWFRVVLWNELAERAATYLHKGNRVYLEGRLETSQYQDRQGLTQTRTEVVASDMIMLGGGGGGGSVSGNDDGGGEEDTGSGRPSATPPSGGKPVPSNLPLALIESELEFEAIPF